ncbi:helix-turn-helix domain-containing protein [Laspinema palackyanum]|uniref:helix-turn-helix domain-containing protein n=1 Tax=Laspinema palackyanum TaxID=3231601 RepID=UPI00345D6D9B|nr:helix-turn-helix transcriptional regulator [Laspinema sp. D2c]
MVTLRIQELAEAKGMTLEQLSQGCGVAIEKIQKYAADCIHIQEETAPDINKIAETLEISSLELLQTPTDIPILVKLKIVYQLESNNLTLEDLSEKTGIHISVLAFYTTQLLYLSKISEPKIQKELTKISEVLGCTKDILIREQKEVFWGRFDIDAFIKSQGLTEKEFILITNISSDCIDLLRTQPVKVSVPPTTFSREGGVPYSASNMTDIWCSTLGQFITIGEKCPPKTKEKNDVRARYPRKKI